MLRSVELLSVAVFQFSMSTRIVVSQLFLTLLSIVKGFLFFRRSKLSFSLALQNCLQFLIRSVYSWTFFFHKYCFWCQIHQHILHLNLTFRKTILKLEILAVTNFYSEANEFYILFCSSILLHGLKDSGVAQCVSVWDNFFKGFICAPLTSQVNVRCIKMQFNTSMCVLNAPQGFDHVLSQHI